MYEACWAEFKNKALLKDINNLLVKEESSEYIDLAVLLGIRKTRYKEKGDKKINIKEENEIIKELKNNGKCIVKCKDFVNCKRVVNEEEIRLLQIYIKKKDNGKTTIIFSGLDGKAEALTLFRNLRKKHRKARVLINSILESSDDGHYMSIKEMVVLKNGEYIEKSCTHEYF